MKIVILGGGGMIGQKLAQEIKSGKIGLNKKNSVILHDLFLVVPKLHLPGNWGAQTLRAPR